MKCSIRERSDGGLLPFDAVCPNPIGCTLVTAWEVRKGGGCGSSQGCSRAGQGQFGTDRTEAEQGSHANCKDFLGCFHVDSPFVLVCVRNYSQYNPEFVQGQSLF